MHPVAPRRSGALFDPRWLFLLSGLALIAAVMLVGSAEDLADARFERDRALAIEEHRLARLAKYEEYLGALDQGEPGLIESLAGSQLNQIPAGRAAIPGTVRVGVGDASVFPALEPPPLKLVESREPTNTFLARAARGRASRLVLLGVGVLAVLAGLLPASPDARTPATPHRQ
jgi:hypothetical protein